MTLTKEQSERIKKYITYGLLIGGMSLIASEVFATATFDIDKGVKAATDPLVNGVKAHWGKGVALSGVGTALLAEGDGRTKAIKAGIGCVAASAVVLGVLATLT